MSGTIVAVLVIAIFGAVAYLIGHTHGASKPTGGSGGGSVGAGVGTKPPEQQVK